MGPINRRVVPILEDPGGYRTWGFYNYVFNSGMGLLDFPGFGFVGHYDQG